MMSNTLPLHSEKRLRALCGLTLAAWEALRAVAVPAMLARRQAQAQRPGRQRAVGGGRKRRLTPAQELLLTLIYLRHNVAHEVVGALFGVSADTSENTFHAVVAVLREVCPAQRWDAEKKWQKRLPAWQPDPEDHAWIEHWDPEGAAPPDPGAGAADPPARILVDTFETPVRRPSQDAAQRRVYSGKQKRHTLKTQVVTDATGEILELDAGHRGPTADKKLYEQSGVAARYGSAEVWADRGYQGTEGMQVPHKKPKGGSLTETQRAENRQHAAGRVYVEHGIRRLKAFRILREDYRLAPGLFPRMAGVVVGLVHLIRLVG